MSQKYADRVKETTTTNGTGTLTLDGAAFGYRTFLSGIGNGNSCYYCIVHQSLDEWEVGLGSVSGGTLSRTSVLSSSNSGSLVNFSGGTKHVFQTAPADFFENLPPGPQGAQGNQGSDGAQGYQGNDGAQGPPGGQGNDGSQGPQGWPGSDGGQGPQGWPGADGSQGPQGWPGTDGMQGSQGYQGNDGSQGYQGYQGADGPQGPPGSAAAVTANRALVSDGSGQVAASSVTDTELGYVSGVTSSIQNQLDQKVAISSPLANKKVYNNGTLTSFAYDCAVSRSQWVVLQGTTTMTISNADQVDGVPCLLAVQQGSVGGDHMTWPANMYWENGTPPTLSTYPNGVDLISFVWYQSRSKWYAWAVRGFPG